GLVLVALNIRDAFDGAFQPMKRSKSRAVSTPPISNARCWISFLFSFAIVLPTLYQLPPSQSSLRLRLRPARAVLCRRQPRGSERYRAVTFSRSNVAAYLSQQR